MSEEAKDPIEAAIEPVAEEKPHNDKEMVEWKRQANIEAHDRKQREMSDEYWKDKLVKWELDRLERENRLSAILERKKRNFHEAVALRRTDDAEDEYRDKMRELRIQQKEEAWRQKEAARAKQLVYDAQFEDRETARLIGEARMRKILKLGREAQKRAEAKTEIKDKNKAREEKITTRDDKRKGREMARVRKIKDDLEVELELSGQNITTVPMKINLVHAVHSASSSELYFALRNMRECVEDLRDAQMEFRAKSQGLKVFQLVKEMEADAAQEHAEIFKTVNGK